MPFCFCTSSRTYSKQIRVDSRKTQKTDSVSVKLNLLCIFQFTFERNQCYMCTMDFPKNLQVPPSVEECIYLMRSYIYIDKYSCEVHIREISPFLAPAFVLGICAQIPFLYQFVKPYIKGNFDGLMINFFFRFFFHRDCFYIVKYFVFFLF